MIKDKLFLPQNDIDKLYLVILVTKEAVRGIDNI